MLSIKIVVPDFICLFSRIPNVLFIEELKLVRCGKNKPISFDVSTLHSHFAGFLYIHCGEGCSVLFVIKVL